MRTTGKDQIDLGRVNWFLQVLVQTAGVVPKLEHIAQNRDAALKPLARNSSHGRKRGAHGRGIGIIALVDQQYGAAIDGELAARAAALRGGDPSECRHRCLDVGA